MKRTLAAITVWALVSGCFAGGAWAAEEARWLTTQSWQGNGLRQTEVVLLGSDECVLRHSHSGAGVFQISMLDAAGKFISMPVNTTLGLDSSVSLTPRGGLRFFKISNNGGPWQVSIEQRLTPADERSLVTAMQALNAPAHKLAEFADDPVEKVRYEFTVSKGRWKIVYCNLDGGVLDLEVTDSNTGLVTLSTQTRQPGVVESWGATPGTFWLRVAAQQTRWKVEIQGE